MVHNRSLFSRGAYFQGFTVHYNLNELANILNYSSPSTISKYINDGHMSTLNEICKEFKGKQGNIRFVNVK